MAEVVLLLEIHCLIYLHLMHTKFQAPCLQNAQGWGHLPSSVLTLLAKILDNRWENKGTEDRQTFATIRLLNKHWHSCVNTGWSTLTLEAPPESIGEFVAKFPQLRCLHLSKRRLRRIDSNWSLDPHPQDFASLSQLHNLVELKMTDVTETEILALRDLPKLSSLEVTCVEVPGSLFESATQLEQLTLSFERGGDGVGFRGLGGMQNLIDLELCYNGMPKSLEIDLLRELTKLTRLGLHRCLSREDANLAPISNLVNLRSLALTGCYVTDPMLSSLEALTQLTALNLGGSWPFQGEGLTVLFSMEGLRELVLCDSSIVQLGPIGELRSLETLDLIECDLEHSSNLGVLSNLTSLDRMSLNFCYNTGVDLFVGREGLHVDFQDSREYYRGLFY